MCDNRIKDGLRGLQFNVSQLLKEPTGATRNYEVMAEVADSLAEDVNVVSPVTGHVKLVHTGTNIMVTGELQANIEKICGRCLTAFVTPVEIEVEEMFYPAVDVLTGASLPQTADVDEANRIDERHILDLSEVTRQEFLLESESFRYCRTDCKGLCPFCGEDLNQGACNCEEENIDIRWAGLKELGQQLENED
jgi:uncharacterized protein